MSTPPERPKIYHITHVKNLAPIASSGALLCDRTIMERGGPSQMIGMSEIKRRRINEIVVTCHPGTRVGDYVPFYFCPRSVMLFVISCRNHPELEYKDGQEPIVHLQADLHRVVEWAERRGVLWAFSRSNAGAYYTEFHARIADLDRLDWQAIAADDFRPSGLKEGKQAEFLIYGRFPFELIELIGVQSATVLRLVSDALRSSPHRPTISKLPNWYFP